MEARTRRSQIWQVRPLPAPLCPVALVVHYGPNTLSAGDEIDLYGVLGLKAPEGDALLSDDREETHNATVSRLRAGFHRHSTRWHPSNFKSRPLVCDECGKQLGFGKGWMHRVGDTYDLCHEDYDSREADDSTYTAITKKEDLGEDLRVYAPEMRRHALRQEAILKFKHVGLAWRVLRDPDLRRIYHSCGWRGLVQAESYAETSAFETDFFEQYDDFFSGKDEDDRQYLLLNGPNPMSEEEEEEAEEEDGGEEADAVPAHGHADAQEEEEELQIGGKELAAGGATAGPPQRLGEPTPLPKPPAEVAVRLMVRPADVDDPLVLRQNHWAAIRHKLSAADTQGVVEPPASGRVSSWDTPLETPDAGGVPARDGANEGTNCHDLQEGPLRTTGPSTVDGTEHCSQPPSKKARVDVAQGVPESAASMGGVGSAAAAFLAMSKRSGPD